MVRDEHHVGRQLPAQHPLLGPVLGIGEQQGCSGRRHHAQGAGPVVVAQCDPRRRMQHLEAHAVPGPTPPGHARLYRQARRAVLLTEHLADGHGAYKGLQATRVVLVGMTQHHRIEGVRADGPEVRHEREAGGRAAAAPGRSRVEDQHVLLGPGHGR